MKTHRLILCALFAALTAVCSYISIPLPFTPVPINLAMLPIFLAGSLLGGRNGFIAAAVYLFMGLVGIPVFHSGTSGLSVLAGPTGGYIVGYLSCAYISGKLRPLAGMTVGLVSCYALGTLWFVLITETPPLAALALCVFPFIPGDALKVAAALLLTKRLEKTSVVNTQK